MVSRLDLMSDHIARVLVCTIFIMTKNIVAPSSLLLKVYAVLKALILRLALAVREFLIYRPSILDLRRCI